MARALFLFILTAAGIVGSACADERSWVADWQETSPLNTPRAGAAAVTAGDFLYAIGGVDGQRFLRTVEYARIRPDGTVTAWQPTASLKEARGFFDVVARDGFLYVAGGGNGPYGENLLRSVERAPIRPDGRLGDWQRLRSKLVMPRRCVKLVVANNALYALGGFGGRLFDTVERALFEEDGGLGAFRLEQDRMTIPRYVNAAKTANGAAYVLGGHRETEGVGHAEVEFALLGGDRLSWKATAAMQLGRYALAAAAVGDFIFALGGLDGARYTDVVEASRIGEDGALSGWSETTPLTSPRANFGAIAHNGRIYVIGGTNRDGYYRSVEYAEVGPRGDIGFRATREEAQAHEQRRAEQVRARQAASRLPNEGVVEEIIHTGAYSYIRLLGAGDSRWIAAPRADYATGERISYSRGVTMTNFHSRALDRDFASILFVERTERTNTGQGSHLPSER